MLVSLSGGTGGGSNAGKLIRTENGGGTWTEVEFSGQFQYIGGFTATYLYDDTLGFTGSFVGGVINRTTDGGLTWKRITNVASTIRKFHFHTSQLGWLVGHSGTIRRTTDGGLNWTTQNSRTNVRLQSVHFTDAQNGWIVGDRSTILKTTDSGNTWVSVSTNEISTFELFDCFFITPEKGWVVGSNRILYTENGGETWVNQLPGLQQDLHGLSFVNENVGWAVGDTGNGAIYYTTDGGENWIEVESDVVSRLLRVCFVDENNGWAVGRGGRILRFGEERSASVNDFEFSNLYNKLNQNYPNPFNSLTEISYELNQTCDNVILAIYDLFGRKVAVLHDGPQTKGTHSVSFNASGLQGGMYFYRLQVGPETHSRFMSLVK